MKGERRSDSSLSGCAGFALADTFKPSSKLETHSMARNQITLPVAGISKFVDHDTGELRSGYINNIGAAFVIFADGVALAPGDIHRIDVVLDAIPVAQPQADGRVRAVLSISPTPRPSFPAEARPTAFGAPFADRRPNPETGLNQLDPNHHYREPPLAGRCCVIDTETTDMDVDEGARILEVAAVELIDGLPTGREFFARVNPQALIAPSATRVHGVRNEDVADAPTFAVIAEEFMRFLADDVVIAHNAEFDLSFLNFELQAAGQPVIDADRAYCTLRRARYLDPGRGASLDKLCARFGIDTAGRFKHGALIDAKLLAQLLPHLRGNPLL
jgi:DNA polymerase-3 subunit epsilon